MSGYRGRWAPSPTGLIHLGNARTALLAWLATRSVGGSLVWRSEDLDSARTQPALDAAARQDLRWLGLDWDEGPDVGGSSGPYLQSARLDHYRTEFQRLVDAGHLYPCAVSRSELAEIASAPHYVGPTFPSQLRPSLVPENWWKTFDRGVDGDGREGRESDLDMAVRFRVEGPAVRFDDEVMGPVEDDVTETSGDFVLKRRDGVYSYQFSVVVDDILMGITNVVRGDDIVTSTGRQILLYRALGHRPPTFAHVPLVLDCDGNKLSKRHPAMQIADMKEKGLDPTVVIGYLAYSCGLLSAPTPITPAGLVHDFAWSRLRPDAWRLEDNEGRFFDGVRL